MQYPQAIDESGMVHSRNSLGRSLVISAVLAFPATTLHARPTFVSLGDLIDSSAQGHITAVITSLARSLLAKERQCYT